MNTDLTTMLKKSEGRYLTPEEQGALLAYARSLPKRLRVAEDFEASEGDLLDGLVETMRARYPRAEQFYPGVWERSVDDARAVLRFGARAMIADDVRMLDDKILFWLRTVRANTDPSPRFSYDLYYLLRETCRERLAPDSFALIAAYLDRAIVVLGGNPEPALAV